MSGPLPVGHQRHRELMQVALRRAVRSMGRTRPNPCVGAVVAKEGTIIAVGHHVRAGEAHGEAVALKKAGSEARGADLYVTLEPCNHHGRTPPCVDAILASGVSRVFVGTQDVNPKVNGQGIARLRRAGVEVVLGLLEAQAREVHAAFLHWVQTGSPLTILKAALSVDGRLATRTGDSAGLSNARAHAWLHRTRDRVDAILVGVGTLLADNPRLTCRRPKLSAKGPHPLVRVVVDTHLRTPASAAVTEDTTGSPVWIFCGPDAPAHAVNQLEQRGCRVIRTPLSGGRVSMPSVLDALGREGITSLLVEGGAAVHGALLEGHLAQRALLVMTPRILGTSAIPMALWNGPDSLVDSVGIDNARWRSLGDNALLDGRIRYGT